MPLLWRSSRESRSERCKRAFLLAPICKVLSGPTLVFDRAIGCILQRVVRTTPYGSKRLVVADLGLPQWAWTAEPCDPLLVVVAGCVGVVGRVVGTAQ